ncbi:hypothetical protein HPB51_001819 [Rhipicephalus microplus]|uniref:Ubiquitin-conjugating enzyme E2 Z n=1 Tax=Rhipicephalus microplus TaxID=6941 RepID=A0A9J6EVI8_RHIMP|nr:hypothetical protein HPB51_001819 [Rhipicephalus microplus]
MATRMQRRPFTAAATPYSAMDEPRRSAATCNLETALAQPKQPSGQCLLRLNHDPKNIIDNPVSAILVEPEKGNVTYIHAVIVGPDNTPCQGGLFHFVLKFPPTTQPVHRRVFYEMCPVIMKKIQKEGKCELPAALPLLWQKPKQPSGQCLLRLNHDLKNIIANPGPGIFVEPEKGNVTYVHAVIVGPDNTPCQRGLFLFVLKFPLDNPACPPQVRFMTTDGRRVRFNMNLYSSGLVSLSIPGTFHRPSWNPAMTLKTVVVSIQLLFIEQPLANEPALGRKMETWLEKTTGYNAKLRSQTLRIAVCDKLEACLLGNSLCLQDLQMAVIKHFVEQ